MPLWGGRMMLDMVEGYKEVNIKFGKRIIF